MNRAHKNIIRAVCTLYVVNMLVLLYVIPGISQSGYQVNLPELHPSERNYQAEDITGRYGLNSAEISALFQDREGYIWVGTKAGVSRFDGLEFINFTNTDGHSLGQVHALEQDESGVLWIGSEEGLFWWNNGSFRKSYLGQMRVRDLHLDSNNNLWVVGFGFIPFYLSPDQRSTLLQDKQVEVKSIVTKAEWTDKIGALHTWAIDTDSDGNAWLGLDDRQAYFDGEQLKVTWVDTLDMYEFNAIEAFHRDSVFWGSEQTGLLFQKNDQLQLQIEPITYIMAATDTNLYFLSSENLVELKDGRWTNLHNLEESGFGHIWAKKMLLDREGNFWIGGVGTFIKLTPARIKIWTAGRHPELISNHGISGLPNGNILIGSYRGRVIEKNNEHFDLIHEFDVASYSYVGDILPDKRGWIWYVTSASGIVLNRKGHLSYYTREEGGLSYNPQLFLYESADGDIWAGGELSISRIKILKNEEVYFENIMAPMTQGAPIFRDMFETEHGLVYAVSDHGIYRKKGDSLARCKLEGGTIDYPVVTGADVDAEGRIWLTTQGQGLLQIEEDATTSDIRIVRQWSADNGLIGNLLLDVHTDQEGRVWTVAPAGVFCMTEQDTSWTIQVFDHRDGWPEGATSHSELYEDALGNLWVMNYNSLVMIPLYNQPVNRIPPKGVISKAELIKESENIFHYASNEQAVGRLPDNLKLPYHKNFLRFYFTATSYTQPDKNSFRYRLVGLDKDWNDSRGSRQVTYPGLQPGDYRFELMAFNNDGIPAESIAAFSFDILPPWYRTWWSYLILGMLLVTGMYYLYRFQLSRKLAVAESQRLKEVNQLKSSLYTNITHEFRTPLTVILGMAEAAQSEIEEKNLDVVKKSLGLIRRNGESLLHLVNEMLDLGKLDSGHLDLRLVKSDIVPFVKYLCESFQSMAQEKNSHLTVYAEIEELIMDFDPAKLSTIVSNLLSNAIKFTQEGGKIIVHLNSSLEGEKEVCLLKIIDNGKGISKDDVPNIFDRFYQVDASPIRQHEGTGIGLALTKELVELMRGTIDVKSEVGKGSEFIVKLPVTRDASPMEDVRAERVASTQFPDRLDTAAEKDELISELPRVLIIEDNEDVIQYLRTCLYGKYHIMHEGDGKKGLERAFEEIPDIVICDVMMPGKDGFEVCATLKADERTDHIPIILLTAKATHQDRLTGLSHGADAYLTKPFSKAELMTRLDQLTLLRKKMIEKLRDGSFNRFLKHPAENPESKFIRKAVKIIHEDIDHHQMGSAFLSRKLGLSESQLYRKLKAITDKSTAIFIRSVRLQMANELIQSTDKSISEVAYAVGFNDPSWFSRAFKEEFGLAPSELVR